VRLVILRLLVLTVAAGLAGCQSTSGEVAGQAVSDASITAAVQSTLTGDRTSNFTRVDVGTERGVVHLSGFVPSAAQKKRAEELARRVNGVVRVDNELQIRSQLSTIGRVHE
jgi:hyperosmotically inducible periplasmic protein